MISDASKEGVVLASRSELEGHVYKYRQKIFNREISVRHLQGNFVVEFAHYESVSSIMY